MVYLVQYCPNMLRKHTFSISFIKRGEGVETQRTRRKTLVEIKNFSAFSAVRFKHLNSGGIER